MEEALLVADAAHQRGFSTLIRDGDICHSACAVIFLGGVRRTADGELGVHQFWSSEPDQIIDLYTVADIVELLESFGTPLSVVTTMLRTPPHEMHVFGRTELAELGLETTEPVVLAEAPPTAAAGEGLTLAAITEFFADLADNPSELRRVIETAYAEIPQERWGTFERYYSGLVGHPSFAELVYRHLDDSYLRDPSLDEVSLFTLAEAIADDTTIRGMLRLDTSSQRQFLSAMRDMYAWIGDNEPDRCLDIVLGTTPSDAGAQLGFRYLVSADPALVAAALETYGAALAAELDEFPVARTLTKQQFVRAEEAYGRALVRLIDRSEDADALYEAAAFPRAVAPQLLCEFTDLGFQPLAPGTALADDMLLMFLMTMID